MMKAGKIFCTILSLTALAGGIMYAAFVHSGYARGQREYASIAQEYTSLFAKPEEKEEEPDSKETEDAVRPQESTQMDDKSIWKVLIEELPRTLLGTLKSTGRGSLKRTGT